MDISSSAGEAIRIRERLLGKPKNAGLLTYIRLVKSDARAILKLSSICRSVIMRSPISFPGKGMYIPTPVPSRLRRGDVFLTRKGQMHAIQADKQSVMRYYYLAFDFNSEVDSKPYSLIKDLFLLRDDLMEKDTLEIDKPFFPFNQRTVLYVRFFQRND